MGNITSKLCGYRASDYEAISERAPLMTSTSNADILTPYIKQKTYSNPEQAAREAINALIRGDQQPLRQINLQLSKHEVRCSSWAESIAENIFNALVDALQPGQPIGDALRDIYDKVQESALREFEFARDHPVETIEGVLIMLVALGILELITPWVIGVLGFTEGGVAAGSLAARWMSTYGGYVPKGSLFSWLQRIGAKGLKGLLG